MTHGKARPDIRPYPLANEFLAIAAVKPDSLPPFPIGGPLGEFEDGTSRPWQRYS
jgi:hypothetical protein